MSGHKARNCVLGGCYAFSALFALFSIILYCLMPNIIHEQIANNVQLKENTASFDNWVKPPVPVYMKFYMFHVKNPYGVQHRKEKPDLEQRGPFTYQEIQNKSDIVFHGNGTLSYRESKAFVFVPHMSNGKESDIICNTNLFLITVAKMLQYQSKYVKLFADAVLEATENKTLLANHTIYEWLWGYNDPLLTLVEDLAKVFNIKLDLPDKVGIYYNKNGSSDGLYTIYTGANGYSNFTDIQLFNGRSDLTFWSSKTANMVNGTDGTSFPPFVTKDSVLYVFSSDLCRSIYVRYNQTVELFGIELYRFIVPSFVMANATTNPANEGFCNGYCLDAGVLNVSVCQKGMPVIMSQPHFFQAGEEYSNAVTGLHPSPALSETYLDIEPHTGMVLRAAKKLQVNIALEPIAGITALKNIPKMFLPFVWVNENGAADQAAAAKFKNEVMSAINLANVLKVALLVIGILFFLGMGLACMYVVFRSHKTRSEDSKLLVNDICEDETGEKV